jgi:seryl-tRNA synthetase
MWDFSMREIIFVGTAEHVLEKREQARKRVEALLGEIGLAYKVESANDPFFAGEFRKQAAFQNAFQLKYEIRANLPFKEVNLAVGSYNYHQNFFGRSLNISLADGSHAHTSCIAFGLERLAFAFLSQFGLDPRAWPLPIGETFE